MESQEIYHVKIPKFYRSCWGKIGLNGAKSESQEPVQTSFPLFMYVNGLLKVVRES